MKNSALLLLLCALCSNACLDDVQQRPPSNNTSPDSSDDDSSNDDASTDEKSDSNEPGLPSCETLREEGIFVNNTTELNESEKCNASTNVEDMFCTQNAPCKTLSGGISELTEDRSIIKIMSSQTHYSETETIVLSNSFDVTIVGVNQNWEELSAQEAMNEFIIISPDGATIDTTMKIVGTMVSMQMTRERNVTLKNLLIQGPDLSNAVSKSGEDHGRVAFTVKAENFAGEHKLTLNNVLIVGGKGGHGRPGTSGELPSGNGEPGDSQNGGATCGDLSNSGGNGGRGGDCDGPIEATAGMGDGAIKGGKAGKNMCIRDVLASDCADRSGEAGDDGDNGRDGQDATQGALNNAEGVFKLNDQGEFVWTPAQHMAPQNNAKTGGPGAGGGGGGGASDAPASPLAQYKTGRNGGGGGGGGCPGKSGTPGQPGGASIALTFNNVLSAGDIQIQYGTGGKGGDGGNSTEGGAGGKGATTIDMCPSGELGRVHGGAGGVGGDGGAGKPGFGGCPGAVVGILADTLDTATLTQPIDSSNLGVAGANGQLSTREGGLESPLNGTCTIAEQHTIILNP